jgi:outer membrane protein assembly factor BamB
MTGARSLALALVCFGAMTARAEEALNRIVLPGESPSVAQRIESARKLARDGQLAEAVDEYQRLIEEAGDKMAPLSQQHFVQARWLCQLDLAALPPEGLRLYRNRVDGRAKSWFEQGAADRDAALLRRLVDEAFCSRYGDRALDLLGDLAFERGRFCEAEGWWRRITLPASEVENRKSKIENRKSLDLVFPDPQGDVARARAKQILARIFQGEQFVSRDGVRAELAAFRRLHSRAEGAFAGRTGNYADTLEALLDQSPVLSPGAGESVSFAGGPTRNEVLPRVARDPNRLLGLEPRWHFNLETPDAPADDDQRAAGRAMPLSQAARSLAFHPVIVDGHVLIADARRVTAFDLRTGKSEIWYDAVAKNAGISPILALPARPDLRYTLTVAEGCVFARLGAQEFGPERTANECPSLLVCLSLRPDADGSRLRWTVTAGTDARECTVFEGAPVVSEGRAYAAVTRFSGGRNITAIHCYPVHVEGTPPLRWRQDVCETPELKAKEERCRHHLLTLAGPNVVYCSHSGAIVALDAVRGRHAWAYRYPSRGSGATAVTAVPQPRDLAPCVYAAGRLYAAPADYDRLLCLNPATGQLLWERDKIEAVHLLGVASDRLIFTTRDGLRALDAATGSDRGGWRLPDVGELAPYGRGFLAGAYVFWPTARVAEPDSPTRPAYRLYVVNQTDGRQPENVGWRDLPGGNLAYGEGCLAVAGPKTLTVYVPPALLREERERGVRQAPRSAAARYELAIADADAGLAPRALQDLDAAERLAAPGECWEGTRLDERVRSARRQVCLDQAERARAAGHWEEATAALSGAEAAAASVPERLAVLRQHAALWAEAGKPARAVEVWQTVLRDPALRTCRVPGPAGAAQEAAQFAQARIDDLLRAHGAGVYDTEERKAEAILQAAKGEEHATVLERLAAEYPNAQVTGPALLELAGLREQAGQLGAAAQAYRLALRRGQAGPERPLAWKGLAEVYEHAQCWPAARTAWQQLAREQGERTLAALDPGRPVRAVVAERLAGTTYQNCCDARNPPELTLPLLNGWQVALAANERLLEPGGQAAGPLLFARGSEVHCRDPATGRLRWSRTLRGPVEWAGQHADTVLAAGPDAVHCLRSDDGGVLWSWVREPAGGPLTNFRLAGGRLFFLRDGRRLGTVDAETGAILWETAAPAANLGLPYPSGRFFSRYHAGEDWVVAQTADARLWVIESRTGRRVHELETSPEPWPRSPLPLGEGRLCLVTDPRTVILLNPAAGAEIGRPRMRGTTTLSGEAPAVFGGPNALVLVVPRNYGPTLQRLDPITGAGLWDDERPLGTDSVPVGAVALDQDAVYLAAGSLLCARALGDGHALWTVPLPGPGRDWRTLVTHDYLVVYPADAGACEVRLEGLFGSFCLAGTFPVHERTTAGVPVLVCDPKTGQLVQRLNLRAAGPEGSFDRTGVGGLLPEVTVRSLPLTVQVSREGIVAALAGRAWGRMPAGGEGAAGPK